MGQHSSELDSDRGWPVSDKVLHLSSGDVGIHELEYVVLVALLGKLDGDGRGPVGDEVFQLATADIGVHELENVVLIGLLGQLDGDRGRSIGDKVLELSTRDIGVHKLEDVVLIGLLGKLDGNGGRSIGNEVLQLATADISIHKLENIILIGFLSKLNSDGRGSISDEVLQLAARDISVHELEDVVFVRLLDVSVELDELLGDGGSLILDEGLERLLGDILAIELANNSLGSSGSRLLEARSSIRDGVVSIIVRETLVELGGDELTTVPLVEDLSTTGWRNTSDHHGDGDVIVVIRILDLISILSEDRSKGIVANNLSESLEGDGVNDIPVEVGIAGDMDSVNLIDGDHERLRVLHHVGAGQLHSRGSPDRGTISVNINVRNNLVESVVRRSLLAVLLVGFLMAVSLFELNEVFLSGNGLETLVARQERGQVRGDGGSEFSLGHGFGTLFNHSLMESLSEGFNFGIDLRHGSSPGGIDANGEKESNCTELLENAILFHFNIINNKILKFINNYFNKPFNPLI